MDNGVDDDYLPVISLPGDSNYEGVPAVIVPKTPATGEPRKAPIGGRLSSAPTPQPGSVPPKPALSRVEGAAAPQAPAEPRKGTEIRKPVSATPPPARPAPAAEPVEEDPEKLLREYAERQKTKVLRLEQQLVELKKVQTEREAYRIKGEALARELTEAKKQLEASAKSDAVIKDLQGKVDAALLSSSMDKDEIGKLRAKNEAFEAAVKKSEEKAAHFERMFSEAQKQLVAQTEGRREAETRVAGALRPLQGEISKPPTVKIPPPDAAVGNRAAEPSAAKPVVQHAAAHATA